MNVCPRPGLVIEFFILFVSTRLVAVTLILNFCGYLNYWRVVLIFDDMRLFSCLFQFGGLKQSFVSFWVVEVLTVERVVLLFCRPHKFTYLYCILANNDFGQVDRCLFPKKNTTNTIAIIIERVCLLHVSNKYFSFFVSICLLSEIHHLFILC